MMICNDHEGKNKSFFHSNIQMYLSFHLSFSLFMCISLCMFVCVCLRVHVLVCIVCVCEYLCVCIYVCVGGGGGVAVEWVVIPTGALMTLAH